MTVTYSEIRQSVETEFKLRWGSTTPISWDNSDLEVLPNGPWVRLTVIPSIAENVVLGSDDVRISGYVAVQVFTKTNQGSGEAFNLADSVATALQNKVLGKVFLYAASVDRVGDGVRMVDQIEQGWYQLNVIMRFEAQ